MSFVVDVSDPYRLILDVVYFECEIDLVLFCHAATHCQLLTSIPPSSATTFGFAAILRFIFILYQYNICLLSNLIDHFHTKIIDSMIKQNKLGVSRI